jgi:hypothetical protein
MVCKNIYQVYLDSYVTENLAAMEFQVFCCLTHFFDSIQMDATEKLPPDFTKYLRTPCHLVGPS